MSAAASPITRLSPPPVRQFVIPCPLYDACEYTKLKEQTGNVTENKGQGQKVESRMLKHRRTAAWGLNFSTSRLLDSLKADG